MSCYEANRPHALTARTRLTLLAGIIGHFTFGVTILLGSGMVLEYLWPPPFDKVPDLWLRASALVDLALGMIGIVALRRNHWMAARSFLSISGICVTVFILAVTVGIDLSSQGSLRVIRLYTLPGLLYFSLILLTWRRESVHMRNNM